MADIKEIPVDELKIAVKSLNSILEEGKIKSVGKTKIAICEGFVAKIQEFAENEKIEDIPEDALGFFNKYFADEDDSEPEKKDVNSGKKDAAKPVAGKTDKKTVKKTVAKAEKVKVVKEKKEVFTREASVAEAFKKGGTFDEIVKNADSIYEKHGGKANLDQSTKLAHKCFKFSKHLDILNTVGDKHSIK